MSINPIEVRRCGVSGCTKPYCAKGYCRLHWERQHKTGTTDDPQPRQGAANSAWKGDSATYGAVHLRMSNRPRPAGCAECGTTEGRFEWALRADAPADGLLISPEGYKYSTDPDLYRNLCKPCHNKQDLGRAECHRGHRLAGDNLYIQPSNGKQFCRACQSMRQRERTMREQTVARSARFEHGESG
ncbi:hypothetical protein [Sphaerisporangium sp. TRM90804]|uniref:hypothetical protein n=1 Tax=Sphaerisporangium sp. TRM90804 TaxID=3031113 RepID=UPI0024494450|nr:hypothetical protein [Sphaerisporangium sp. TRM90804]MDH2424807.1 hypothetical protein [Sphaerisporangium sp. TRM90804]